MVKPLEERLPPVRGRITTGAALGPMTWFGVGGPAEVLFKPADRDDLIDFIRSLPVDVPVTVLGVASNVIIRDGGIPGVVVRLGREFAGIRAQGLEITAGAAALDTNVAHVAMQSDIAGLEFLSGVPGTIGGALRMNAGAYGGETAQVLINADVLFHDGSIKHMTPAEMRMSYRHNSLPEDVIFLGARLKGTPGKADEIRARMEDLKVSRANTQPIRSKTGGSTFANPPGKKAWKLIDAAGCRGLKIGGAMMSEMHANFMINDGTATAADLENLGEEVRRRVYAASGVMLEWEIRRIGVPGGS